MKVTVETAADGTGTIVPAQTMKVGDTLTCYPILRDDAGNFASNVVADSPGLGKTTTPPLPNIRTLTASADKKTLTFKPTMPGGCVSWCHVYTPGVGALPSGAIHVVAA